MNEKCPNCGYDLTLTFRKDLEKELQGKYFKKQEEIINKFNSQIEEIKIKNQDLKNKLENKNILLKERLKLELKTEFSKKEIDLETQKLDLENKLKSLEDNKEKEIKLALMKGLQRQEKELSANFTIEQTEKNEQIIRLQDLIKELKNKSIQNSQQAKGEAGELLIENALKIEFPIDRIEEVPKGINGADISYYVRDAKENELGLICIESKNAKKFSYSWINKLKDDMKRKNANFGLIVTVDIPKDQKKFEEEDLFICGFSEYVMAIKLLRNNIIEQSKMKSKVAFKNDKKSLVYDYVTGKEFANWIRTILDYLRDQKNQLEIDKRSMQKSFAIREKQIDKVIESQQTLIGHFKGLGTGNDFKVLEDTNEE